MQKKIFAVFFGVLFALFVFLVFELFKEDGATSESVEKKPLPKAAALENSSAKVKVAEPSAPLPEDSLPEEPQDTPRLEPDKQAEEKPVTPTKVQKPLRRTKQPRRVKKARSTSRLAHSGQGSTQQDKDITPKEEQRQVTMLSPAWVKKDVERCAAISRKIEETRNLTTEIDKQIISLLQHTEITREVEWIPEISGLLFALRTDRMALEQEVAYITNEMAPWLSRKGVTQSP